MRLKQPKKLFPARNERRPVQEIPTEAARIKARMARMLKVKQSGDPAVADVESKSET